MKRLQKQAASKQKTACNNARPTEIAPDFTSPAFIKGVQQKIDERYFRANTRKSTGKRFPKGISSDPVFRAIAYCQSLHHKIQRLAARSVEDSARALGAQLTEDLKTSINGAHEGLLKHYQMQRKPELENLIAGEFLNAAIQSDIARLQELVDLCRLHKERRLDPLETKRYQTPWHYFVGLAARMFLTKKIIPTKKQVVEAAIQHRAALDAFKKYGEGTMLLESEIAQLSKSKPNWTRIFRDLGLGQLPSASTHPR